MNTTPIVCPDCRAVLQFWEFAPSGKNGRCPKCEAVVVFTPPAAGTKSDSDDDGSRVERTNHGTRPSDGSPPAAVDFPADPGTRYPFLRPPQKPDEIGRLGPYRVLGAIGKGGMGAVFRAEELALDRVVALKVMLPEVAENAKARERFLREAKLAARVEHDHIVPVFRVGEDNGVPYLAMPLLKGESLDERLKRERQLPIAEAVRIGREVAEGLQAAHEHGLIHRDIKPANIWLEGAPPAPLSPREGKGPGGEFRRVKILDFGLARAATGDVQLTSQGEVMGTPAYMSPEQARGADAVDHRADLFSLGGVLYRTLTGRLPFRGESPFEVLRSLATDEPLAPRSIRPAITAELEAVVLGLLAKRPEDRPRSAAEVARLLSESDLAPPVPEVSVTLSLPETTRVRADSQTRWTSSRWRVWLSAALGLVVVVLFLAWAMSGNPGEPSRPTVMATTPEGPPPVVEPNPADEIISTATGMRLARLPAGRFFRGSSVDDNGALSNEKPRKQVTITKAFYLGKYEVTRAQFRKFVEDDDYETLAEREASNATWAKATPAESDECPVNHVTWGDAAAFCAWMAKKEGKPYRLPTEAEWEYACRGGTSTKWWCGDDPTTLTKAENLEGNEDGFDRAAPVGRFKPNPFGLYDMHGNVWEWCADRYDAEYYHKSDGVDPIGPADGRERVYRGGCWIREPVYARSAARYSAPSPYRFVALGFRVALSP